LIPAGKFITFEGPEGSGKSTQAGVITGVLREKGINAVRTREPGGVSISEELREILLKPGGKINPRTELLLYAACRAQHTEELIKPALERGDHVICERYTHASLAYQGYGRQLDIKLIRELNAIATAGVSPDLTVILDIEPEKGLERVASSERTFDRLESEDIEFHRRVRSGYIELASLDPYIEIVDASRDADTITSDIIALFESRQLF